MKKEAPSRSERTGRNKTAPLDSQLRYELSGVSIAESGSDEPICKQCDNLGAPGNELLIEAGESIYVSAYWKERSGWKLFGIYHDTHDISDLENTDPPCPVAILRGRLKKTGRGGDDDAYTLVNLALEEVTYPEGLCYWPDGAPRERSR